MKYEKKRFLSNEKEISRMSREKYVLLLLFIPLFLVMLKPMNAEAAKDLTATKEFTITYYITSDWGDGFNGELVITNTGKEDITGWVLEFDFDRNIQSFWTAKVLEHKQNHYKITHDEWNKKIKQGESITLGFGGNGGNKKEEPENYKLFTGSKQFDSDGKDSTAVPDSTGSSSGVNYEVSIKITSEWEHSYNAEVIIKNTGDKTIENWQIVFDSSDEITTIWNGKIKSKEESSYIIQNDSWNQDIKPNQKVSFGYMANYKDQSDLPESFSMDMICVKVDKNLYEYNNKIITSWENGYTGEIEIKNISSRTIEDWKINFESPSTIDKFYDATILHKENDIYFVDNNGYDGNLLPGNSIKLGYISKSTDKGELSNFDLLEMKLYNINDYIVDSDSDGIPDYLEIEQYKTSPTKSDTDGDGFTDYEEIYILFTDPLKMNDSNADTDKDGISNKEELKLGTDPINQDTDDDSLSDYDEICVYNTDPMDPDMDKDGLLDGEEILLKLDPKLIDTFKEGVKDSERYILQTYAEAVDDAGIRNIILSMECQGYINNNIFLMNLWDIFDIQARGMVGVPIDVDIFTKYKNSGISFEYDKSLLAQVTKQNLMIGYYEEDNTYYSLLESSANSKDYIVSAKLNTSGVYFLVDKSKLSKEEINNKKVLIKKKTEKKASSNKLKLKKQLLAVMKKDKAFQSIKGLSRTYSLEKSFNMVVSYTKEAADASKDLKVNKALIQAILMREIACLNPMDAVADTAVIDYFRYKQEFEDFMNAPIWKQFLLGVPKAPLVTKTDCSTGLGQIFAKTAMKAMNYFINKGTIQGTSLKLNDWKTTCEVWQSLKYDDAYNINKVSLVLKHEGELKNYNSLVDPNKETAIFVLGKYNGSSSYGKTVYQYYKLFKKYKV